MPFKHTFVAYQLLGSYFLALPVTIQTGSVLPKLVRYQAGINIDLLGWSVASAVGAFATFVEVFIMSTDPSWYLLGDGHVVGNMT